MNKNYTKISQKIKKVMDPNNVNSCDLDGWTWLHYAACACNKIEVEKLLQLGADVNAQTKAGNTALHFALHQYPDSKFYETVKILIEYGANVTIKNLSMRRPLDNIRGDKEVRRKIEDLILQYDNVFKVAINE